MTSKTPRRLLIAPLDWGLGHTTRCIPIIRYLLSLDHRILFAGDESQRDFIKKTFPGIDTVHLEGYHVHYGKTAGGLAWSLVKQLPGIFTRIRQEHKWLNDLVGSGEVDAVISDNRYGLYHRDIPSVFITHQLSVRTGAGGRADKIFRSLHYRYINRFHACWVPDLPGDGSLAEGLSHPDVLPRQTHYIGWLSHLAPLPGAREKKPETRLLILLSGPEPQRSILSEILWKQCLEYPFPIVFIEGSAGCKPQGDIPAHITWKDRVAREELQPLLESASLVICRSGYSTLMDLMLLGKKAVIIPTPGQTEQEYLADRLHRKKFFYTASQEDLRLDRIIRETGEFHFIQKPAPPQLMEQVVDSWLATL